MSVVHRSPTKSFSYLAKRRAVRCVRALRPQQLLLLCARLQHDPLRQEFDFPGLYPPPAPRPIYPRGVHHTLPVRSHDCDGACSFVGILPEFAFALRVADTHLSKYAHWAEYALPCAPAPDIRLVWSADASVVFAARIHDSECHALTDTMQGMLASCQQDWSIIMSRSETRALLLVQEASSVPADDLLACTQDLSQVHDVLLRRFVPIGLVFNYFAATGRGSMQLMPIAGWAALLDTCGFLTGEDKVEVRMTLFEDCARGLGDLRRCDFIEALIRLALLTTSGDPWPGSTARGLEICLDRASTMTVASHDANDFRRMRLYSPRVERIYKDHLRPLLAIFRVYTAVTAPPAKERETTVDGAELAQVPIGASGAPCSGPPSPARGFSSAEDFAVKTDKVMQVWGSLYACVNMFDTACAISWSCLFVCRCTSGCSFCRIVGYCHRRRRHSNRLRLNRWSPAVQQQLPLLLRPQLPPRRNFAKWTPSAFSFGRGRL